MARIGRRHVLAGITAPLLIGSQGAFAKSMPGILIVARDAPPRCVRGFRTTSFAADTTVVPTAAFRLACERCRGETFSVFERSVTLENDVTSTGLSVQCSGCTTRTNLFDMRWDGYDGEFGNNKYIRGTQSEGPLKDADGRAFGEVKIRVAFTYNSTLKELRANAREARTRPQDLFDWFTLDVSSGPHWIEDAWDCECA